MSSEPERRLEGFLQELPHPALEVGERALAASLAALRPSSSPRRALRTALVVLAAACVLLAIAAGSLAAAGALHVSFGHSPAPRPTTALSLPKGANGIAVVVNGELDVVTKSGFRLQGLNVSAAALSPHALYVAAGIGNSLVALAPDGRRAWSHPAGGPVKAIAWAPDGLRIAYVVGTRDGAVLHVIWGNGTNDTVIDRSVRAVRPSWIGDSLAFAYVGAGGKAVVYDLSKASRRVVGGSPSDVTQVAFSTSARQLALLGGGRVGVGDASRTHLMPRGGFPPVTGIGWVGRDLLVESVGSYVAVQPIGILPAYRPLRFGGPVIGVSATGSRFVAIVAGRSPRIVAGTSASAQTVLRLPRGATVGDLGIA